MTTAIAVEGVSKRFRLYKEKYTSLKERVLHAGKIPYVDFWALRDVEFDVKAGETVGILGRNGSGKSTLLKCMAGILKPSAGQITVRGDLAAMLELGAGFQPELSGRDNIFLNASLLGMPRREIEKRFDEIVAFAELEAFIDNQVRFYSSGMYVRLGFAVAVNVEPDILLVDEVLAVGDERFQQKCMDRVHQFQREGRTIVVVSHAADVMRQICDRVVVIDGGEVVAVAPPGEAIGAFRDHLLQGEVSVTAGGEGDEPAVEIVIPSERRINVVRATARSSAPSDRDFLVPGDSLRLEVEFQVNEPLSNVAFGCAIFAANGGLMFDGDSAMSEIHQIHDLVPGHFRVEFDFDDLPLLDGIYTLNARIQDAGGGVVHARIEPAATFRVVNPGQTTGLVRLPITIGLRELEAPPEAVAPSPHPEHRLGDPDVEVEAVSPLEAGPIETVLDEQAAEGERAASVSAAPEESLLG